MNEKARKYIDLFRKVKIATAATVDEEEHNVCPADAVKRLHK